jgi:glutaconate CoA-transferase, subunit A
VARGNSFRCRIRARKPHWDEGMETARRECVMRLEEAAALIEDGSTIGVGGLGIRGHPMALLYQLARQDARELTMLGITNGNDADLLAGAGCLRRLETAAVSLEEFGLAPNFRRAVEGGRITLGEYTETTMMDRLLAASMGLSFFPTRVLRGSDVPKVNLDIREIMCPYTGEMYHVVPPARPQWAVLHAPAADAYGNVLYPHADALVAFDRLLSRAAEQIIVTVEKIVPPEAVEAASHEVLVPAFKTAAVVEVPFGAHPCAFGRWYNRDVEHLRYYVGAGRTQEGFKRYPDQFILGVNGHADYLQQVGGLSHLLQLRLDGMVGL